MKNILLAIIIIAFTGCKYDDSYLTPSLDTIAYFASETDYTRTLVVGEGLYFKIGTAMAGEIANAEDRSVALVIDNSVDAFVDVKTDDGVTADADTRELMPLNLYNSKDFEEGINVVIPKGQFIGYFDVKMDSAKFLNDPKALSGAYTLPVKILSSSLGIIGKDSVNISVKYMSAIDGFYLYESTIEKEEGGAVTETIVEKFGDESDNNAWTLITSSPFGVIATGPTTSFCKDLKFGIEYKDGVVAFSSVIGQPVVEADGENIYDTKTGDFTLNFKYQRINDPAVYHVSTKFIFRNRVRDGINETRDYLSYFRK